MSGGRWIAKYPGGGVRIALDVERDRQELRIELSVLRRVAGDKIVANLCRAFAGCDRLTSLAHMSILNTTLPEDSVARQRNIQTLGVLTFGALHELAKVLDDLRRSGIEGALSDPAPWLRIDAVRRRWLRDTADHLRNRLAFHLGHQGDAARSLDDLQSRSDEQVLGEAQLPPVLVNIRHPLGDEVLFAAAAIQEDDVKAIILQSPLDSADVTHELEAITRDLLRKAGAQW